MLNGYTDHTPYILGTIVYIKNILVRKLVYGSFRLLGAKSNHASKYQKLKSLVKRFDIMKNFNSKWIKRNVFIMKDGRVF
jgi:hypothetical protein